MEESRDLQDAGLEVSGGEQDALHALNDATYDSGAHVEQTRGYEESEAIETAFTVLVDNRAGSAELTPGPLADESRGTLTPQELDTELPQGRIEGRGMPDEGLGGGPGQVGVGLAEPPGAGGLEDMSAMEKDLGLESPFDSSGPGLGKPSGPLSEFDEPLGEMTEPGIPEAQIPGEREMPTGIGGTPILSPDRGPMAADMAAEPFPDKDVPDGDKLVKDGEVFLPSEVYDLGLEGAIYDAVAARDVGGFTESDMDGIEIIFLPPTGLNSEVGGGHDSGGVGPLTPEDLENIRNTYGQGVLVTEIGGGEGDTGGEGEWHYTADLTQEELVQPYDDGSGGFHKKVEASAMRAGAEQVTDYDENIPQGQGAEKEG